MKVAVAGDGSAVHRSIHKSPPFIGDDRYHQRLSFPSRYGVRFTKLSLLERLQEIFTTAYQQEPITETQYLYEQLDFRLYFLPRRRS